MCKYLRIHLHIVVLMKNMVASDREGNWDLHVATVYDSMPVFKEFDCLHTFGMEDTIIRKSRHWNLLTRGYSDASG